MGVTPRLGRVRAQAVIAPIAERRYQPCGRVMRNGRVCARRKMAGADWCGKCADTLRASSAHGPRSRRSVRVKPKPRGVCGLPRRNGPCPNPSPVRTGAGPCIDCRRIQAAKERRGVYHAQEEAWSARDEGGGSSTLDVAAYRRSWEALRAQSAAIRVRDDIRAKVRAMIDRVAADPLIDPRVHAIRIPDMDYRAGGAAYKRRPKREPGDVAVPAPDELAEPDVTQLVKEVMDASLV